MCNVTKCRKMGLELYGFASSFKKKKKKQSCFTQGMIFKMFRMFSLVSSGEEKCTGTDT